MVKIKKKIYGFLKNIWPFLVIAIIVMSFFINKLLAIWITIVFLILSVIVYIPSLSLKSRLVNSMTKHLRIEDKELALYVKKTNDLVREVMRDLSRKQKRKDWLIVHLNNRYIFYNEETISVYKHFYYRGFTDKQIFENMPKSMNLKTRSEVKAIENALKTNDRILEREIIMKKKSLKVDTYPHPIKKLGKT